MYEVEIWIDVVRKDKEHMETLCTLFGRQKLPMHPVVGERLSFHQGKTTNHRFSLVHQHDVMPNQHIVGVDVENISHYASPNKGGVLWNTSIRCEEILVASAEDAKSVCEVMKILGFEIAPYGVNKLEE
jgi:hypothetical protein